MRKEYYTRQNRIAELISVPCNQKPMQGIDSGAKGKAWELLLTPDTSRKTDISKPGQQDIRTAVIVDGVKYGIEAKTNGGRLGALERALNAGKDGYVVYVLDICNAGTSHKRRATEPRIFRYSVFMDMCQKVGALKANSRDGETCIQATSKKLYKALEEYPLLYTPGKDNAFEGWEFDMVYDPDTLEWIDA